MNAIVAYIMEMPAVVEQLDARELLKQRFVMFPPGTTQEQMLAALAQPRMPALVPEPADADAARLLYGTVRRTAKPQPTDLVVYRARFGTEDSAIALDSFLQSDSRATAGRTALILATTAPLQVKSTASVDGAKLFNRGQVRVATMQQWTARVKGVTQSQDLTFVFGAVMGDDDVDNLAAHERSAGIDAVTLPSCTAIPSESVQIWMPGRLQRPARHQRALDMTSSRQTRRITVHRS